MTKHSTVYDGIFILLIAFICHELFSRYGFNPTDEGFVLSATNRVMHGQIPHVDFSSVRPLGYSYLHIPELLFSKKHFFLISRFVFWLEQVLIAFLWIRVIQKITKLGISRTNNYILVVITLIFNVHYFPCSVLHTIDGLLLCLMGLNLVHSSKKYAAAGFFFIGFAALCKQNYLIMLPVTAALFGRKNAAVNLTIGLVPIIAYVSFITLNGGWDDLTIQLGSHHELWEAGVHPYSNSRLFYLSILAVWMVSFLNNRWLNIIYLSAVFAVCWYALSTFTYHEKYSFFVFGSMLGHAIFQLYKRKYKLMPVFIICSLLAWCVSISVGYNTPALFLGGCLALWLYLLLVDSKESSPVLNYSSCVLLLASFIIFYHTRTAIIYRDASLSMLTYRLDGIVEGASGIYTNKNTYAVLKELDSLKSTNPDLIALPDFTACSILQSNTSAIKTEWPNRTEIPNKKILQKVIHELEKDSSVILAIPKFNTAFLSIGLFKIDQGITGRYLFMDYVYANYIRFTSTAYFDLFRKKI
jgi:hypothetical protein